MADRKPFRLSLSGWILLAFVLGIGCGLFFGERTAFLQGVADAFIRLLQMAVLPYVTVSLVAGLGSLTYREAGFLARQGGLLLIALWVIILGTLLAVPLAYPEWQSASFFSTTLVEPRSEFDFVRMYIPANPFNSMAENAVPAVVLFCIAVGVALVGVPGRETLIENLNVLSKALARVTTFVVTLTPIGVFAIAASAAGTMTLEDFGRLQVHVLSYVAAALLLSFWVLPGLISALTDIRYRDVISLSRDALVTAFSTGSIFVVLPLLSSCAKSLVQRLPVREDRETESVIDVIVPVSFNFPHAGKLSAIVFVLFASWYSGAELPLREYPMLAMTGLFTLFGSVNVAVPFLLDLFRVPADMFQLFVAVGIINARFATLVAAMNILVLAIVGTCAVSGLVTFRPQRLLRYAAVSIVLAFVALSGVRWILTNILDSSYQGSGLITARKLSQEPVEARIRSEVPTDMAPRPPGETRVHRIQREGVLRVGYEKPSSGDVISQSLPFAYFNAGGELVGFDIDMAHRLARDFRVALEFVPFDTARVGEHLAADHFDIAMTGFVIGDRGTSEVTFSAPIMEVTLGFVVRDHRRAEFVSTEALRAKEGLRIALGPSPYYRQRIGELFPLAELVPDVTAADFLEGRVEADALATAAEAAAAWTLLYPQFSVVVPQPIELRAPVAYPMAQGDLAFSDLVSNWVELKRLDGTIDAFYRYWILGRDEKRKTERWSVIRDVLHWVD